MQVMKVVEKQDKVEKRVKEGETKYNEEERDSRMNSAAETL